MPSCPPELLQYQKSLSPRHPETVIQAKISAQTKEQNTFKYFQSPIPYLFFLPKLGGWQTWLQNFPGDSTCGAVPASLKHSSHMPKTLCMNTTFYAIIEYAASQDWDAKQNSPLLTSEKKRSRWDKKVLEASYAYKEEGGRKMEHNYWNSMFQPLRCATAVQEQS